MEMTREEKSDAMTRLVYAIRQTVVENARKDELNIAEVLNAMGQSFASVIVGAYEGRNREIVVAALPDLIRAYYPQWESIYAAHGHQPVQST